MARSHDAARTLRNFGNYPAELIHAPSNGDWSVGKVRRETHNGEEVIMLLATQRGERPLRGHQIAEELERRPDMPLYANVPSGIFIVQRVGTDYANVMIDII